VQTGGHLLPVAGNLLPLGTEHGADPLRALITAVHSCARASTGASKCSPDPPRQCARRRPDAGWGGSAPAATPQPRPAVG
jgi:hypothetical protein